MSANYRPEDPKVRSAIFKVFGGKCFYSGREVGVDEMVVDHIVPRSKGGEDSVYNYALTTKDINSKKSALLDKDGVGPVLYLVKTVYAPKVLRLLNRKERKPAIRGEKKRVTIYIDSADWLMVRKAAIDRGVSAGEYLMDLHRANSQKKVSRSKKRHPFNFDNAFDRSYL